MKTVRGSQTHRVVFGSREIVFDLRFADRGSLSITVHPDLRVTVSAPEGRTLDEVLGRVRRRAGWIAKQIRSIEEFHPFPPERLYLSGETHWYLGRQYRLKVVCGDETSVKLSGPFIVVTSKNEQDRSRIKQLVTQWYRDRARATLPRYVAKCLSAAKSLELGKPRIQIRKLMRRWGSCTKTKTIILNSDLVHTPPYCIEYVIMHELCHLRVHDHTPRFFQVLSRCMPDWERRKARLDRFVL